MNNRAQKERIMQKGNSDKVIRVEFIFTSAILLWLIVIDLSLGKYLVVPVGGVSSKLILVSLLSLKMMVSKLKMDIETFN